jgi:GDPmannose 4,6-dehydratase
VEINNKEKKNFVEYEHSQDGRERDPNKKVALITGVAGQIGSYLAEVLIEKGYEVYGIIRRSSQVSTARERIDPIIGLNVLYGDLGDSGVIERIVSEVQPDEIYNLAAQSHVAISFEIPEYTSDVTALGALRICEAARKLKKNVKIYQASTSELYGGIYDYAVNEETPFHPKSPYGVAKLYAFWMMKNYRESYGLFCSNGIVFNSESSRRSENFVTRKITKGVAEIMNGKKEKIQLGNLNAKRDWNHSKDTAEAMWIILQADKPGDYVMASGISYSVRDFVEASFRHVGVDIVWKGEGLNEVGYDKNTGKEYIVVNPYYFRPSEVEVLIGDSSKLRNELGWSPKFDFNDIVAEMVDYDMKHS